MFRLTRKASVFALITLFFALGQAHAATVATFDVTLTGTITAGSNGTVTGTGTATLDDTGVLSLLYTSNAVTGFTNTFQDVATNFYGTYGANTLSSTSGDNQTLACTPNGGILNGCDFLGPIPTPVAPWTVSGLPLPILFDLAGGGLTTFDASNTTGAGTQSQAVTAYTFVLTTVPEPGTALLIGGGLAALSAARRRRA